MLALSRWPITIESALARRRWALAIMAWEAAFFFPRPSINLKFTGASWIKFPSDLECSFWWVHLEAKKVETWNITSLFWKLNNNHLLYSFIALLLLMCNQWQHSVNKSGSNIIAVESSGITVVACCCYSADVKLFVDANGQSHAKSQIETTYSI